jgi:hypothetical protein
VQITTFFFGCAKACTCSVDVSFLYFDSVNPKPQQLTKKFSFSHSLISVSTVPMASANSFLVIPLCLR